MLLLTQGKVYQEYYNGKKTLSGASTNNWIVDGLNFNSNDRANFWGLTSTNISAKIMFFLKSPYSGTINMKVRYDDGFGLWVNDAVKFGSVWGSADVTKYFDLNLVKDQFYSWYTEWCQGWCGLYYALYVNYPGVSYSAISSNDIFLPSLVGASPYNINIADSICGDGFRTGTEAWDDGNKNSGDGWSLVWSTESGWTCSGGSQSNKDICNEICGDGYRIGAEIWDDGNKNSGDGWSSVWSTESGWTCSGGSQSNKDICNEICGDGVRFNSITTYWDDGNIISLDGWDSVCKVENGWKWTGGTNTTKDIWNGDTEFLFY